MVFVSMGFRFRVQAEAMNMVESWGNYTRHRIIPVIKRVRTKNGVIKYKVQYAPAVSGQSINYAFMKVLTNLAIERNLPVCDECKRYELIGGFPKRPEIEDNEEKKLINESFGYLKVEGKRVLECVVEDITGFMAVTETERGGKRRTKKEKNPEKETDRTEKGAGVKRTAKVWFSYLLPDPNSDFSVGPQFHVRFNRENPDEQAVIQVESGSAIYTLYTFIDVDGIGAYYERANDRYVLKYVNNRRERIKLVFDALMLTLSGLLGAKQSRYLSIRESLSGIAVVSKVPFMVSPVVFGYDYVQDTVDRAKIISKVIVETSTGTGSQQDASSESTTSVIKIFYYDREGIHPKESKPEKKESETYKEPIEINEVSGPEDMINKVKETVLNMLK
ncbi:DevR family CRISPR-associated autoregulator [Caldivirga maquilingensis]|uniref:CRISPR-associated autoregulator, DevR family n=1 Tax=Caldivirga maquilingensis (strain ATCC 700844 / DSM 13496 / JCM 10307 / IC-167) TaxID=397948 RepID=A8M9C7_CALMQ|nr:DevR family CRISPR-associated autoregulator [Caldivirga maquilingensis]ABW02346.1 CRISPR-associated autoregulator, DevR family [Caldivirga maquilingensis IC-167]